MMKHSNYFKSGTRVLLLVGRNKDGATPRRVTRVSHDENQFDRLLEELVTLAREGERVYASVNARDVRKATRLFKHRQVEAEMSQDPSDFYRRMNSHWTSCLMNDTCQVKDKLWMFDCDYPADVEEIESECALKQVAYIYNTKNGGAHLFVRPFDRSQKFLRHQTLLHTNPMMLWSY